ncbi:beta-N-acetylhexosaminidase, partial [Phenylobacterium sp.]|uniref:beta-N-acetylhexosaminidase n=1 Tax=Phenylobacterium sp. TaxID=1871053 RepID=UPI002E2F2919
MAQGIRIGLGAAAAFLVAFGGACAAAAPALMPWPREISTSAGALPVDEGLEVVWTGFRDARLERAADRFRDQFRRRTGLVPTGRGPRLTIHVRGDDPALLTPEAREGYRLEVARGAVRLEADGPAGALRGLATLRQLVVRGQDGFELPTVVIEDGPRFAWRGLMIDVARHFVSVETLKRQIDAMEAVKLNVLHLHLSDDEGFRVESRRLPRLTEVASHGEYYTQDEVRDLVAYAAERGVRIVPEFDVPGHTGAILSAYPELSAAPVDPKNRIGLMSLAMDPTKPETFVFLETLFAEMAGLFPDAYFHVGGDEVNAAAWTNNPSIRAYMAAHGHADAHALQREFSERVRRIVQGLGKTPVAWEEVAERPIDDGTVVQAWRSSEALAHVTGQGNRAIATAGYYLDLLWPGLDHYARDPADLLATPPDNPSLALGPKPTGPLSAEQSARLLGVEAALWTMTVSEEMVDAALWPRSALLAERFWSPAEVRDPDDASRRVVSVQEGLRIEGLADSQQRRRMAARLAPADAEAVEVLASATGPVRNFGRLWEVFDAVRKGRPPQAPKLNTLADVAAPDSVELHRLSTSVARFLRGDRTEAAALKAQLALYRDNHSRFIRAAEAAPALQDAVPVSADLAALAQAGLDAVALIERGGRPSEGWKAETAALLKRQADAA